MTMKTSVEFVVSNTANSKATITSNNIEEIYLGHSDGCYGTRLKARFKEPIQIDALTNSNFANIYEKDNKKTAPLIKKLINQKGKLIEHNYPNGSNSCEKVMKMQEILTELEKPKTKTIYYCKCGQAVRLRKRDNIWIHYGYKRMNEPYSEFLERTNHPVEIADKKDWEAEK